MCDAPCRYAAGRGRLLLAAVGALSLVLSSSVRAAASGLGVEECVQLALARSPGAQAAAADEAAAAARVRAARAAYWPRLLGQAQYGHSEGYDVTVTNGGVTQLGVAIDASVCDGGLRAADLSAARAHLRSAAALAQQRRADVAFAVRSAYAAALAARRRGRDPGRRGAGAERLSGPAAAPSGARLGAAPATCRAPSWRWTRRAQRRAGSDGGTRRRARASSASAWGCRWTAPRCWRRRRCPRCRPTAEVLDASPLLADARAAAEAARHDADAVRSERRGRFALNADGGFLGRRSGDDLSRQRRRASSSSPSACRCSTAAPSRHGWRRRRPRPPAPTPTSARCGSRSPSRWRGSQTDARARAGRSRRLAARAAGGEGRAAAHARALRRAAATCACSMCSTRWRRRSMRASLRRAPSSACGSRWRPSHQLLGRVVP